MIEFKVYVNDKLIFLSKNQQASRRVVAARLRMEDTRSLRYVSLFKGKESVLMNVADAKTSTVH